MGISTARAALGAALVLVAVGMLSQSGHHDDTSRKGWAVSDGNQGHSENRSAMVARLPDSHHESRRESNGREEVSLPPSPSVSSSNATKAPQIKAEPAPNPPPFDPWYQWNHTRIHAFRGRLHLRCGRIHGLNHGQLQRFFREVPRCSFLTECGASLPVLDGAKVGVEHSTYVERYTTQIRYMHMPMLARMHSGGLFAIWQASRAVEGALKDGEPLAVEGLDSQHLRMSFCTNGKGTAWSRSVRVPIPQSAALWSPVPHVDEDGRTWLFYTESAGCRKSFECTPCRHPRECRQHHREDIEVCQFDPPLWVPGGDIKVVTTDDPLALKPHWTAPRLLLSADSYGGIPKVICNRMVVLSSGEWLLPYWREQTSGAVEDGSCRSRERSSVTVVMHENETFSLETKPLLPGSDCRSTDRHRCSTGTPGYSGVLRSTDKGQTWQPHGAIMLPHTHLIEGSLAELSNGKVLMIFRTQSGCLHKSLSHDRGVTWSQARPMDLPNPNSKVHLMKMEPSGQLLLAFNNHRGANTFQGLRNCRGCRTHLHLAMSADDGETWRHVGSLDDEISTSAVRIHYPCMLQLGEEPRLLVTYSRFYLGSELGLNSPDQGVVFQRLNIQEVLQELEGQVAPASSQQVETRKDAAHVGYL